MGIDIEKEKALFEKSCNGRYKEAFAKGWHRDKNRYFDGGLSKLWHGWMQHVYFLEGQKSVASKPAKEMDDYERAMLQRWEQ